MFATLRKQVTGVGSIRKAIVGRRWTPAPLPLATILLWLAIVPLLGGELSLAAAGEAGDQRAPLATDATIRELEEFALTGNPGLDALNRRWQAARAAEGWAGKLPEPRVSAGYYLEEVETRVGPQQWRFGISQSFPWFGERALRSDMAQWESERRRHMLESAELNLVFRLRVACYEYAFLAEAIEINGEDLELLSTLNEVALTRYRSGDLSWSHLLRLQGRTAKLTQEIDDLGDRQRREAVTINALLGRSQESPIGGGLRLPALQPGADHSPRDSSLAANPRLRTVGATVEKQRSSLDLAGKQFLPDFTVGMDYIVTGDAMRPDIPGSGTDPLILRLGLKLPLWWGSYRAAENEAAADLRAAESERRDLSNALAADLQRALVDRGRFQRLIKLHDEDLIPLARQILSVAESEFRTGEGEFETLMTDHRILLDYRLARLRARTDLARADAEIRMLLGAEDGRGDR